MINLPAGLANFMKGQKFDGLKPFAILFRNKWVLDDESESESESESGASDAGHFELDTANPIDISAMIAKPNTLSMTLDVNEVAQYNCNNITVTLADPQNRFIEGVPGSFFPDGYQLYGSRVVLYYGTDNTNRTPIFTGAIKELPTHKPENYQVDLKLVSPLEMLKDIEAKEFSDKYIGEILTYIEDDDEGHKIYNTNGLGVGGFYGVYANNEKMFEGVDYEVSQTNALGLPAIIKVINSNYYGATIIADYYTWKTGLTVEQIIEGLVLLAGYNSGNEDIRRVQWNNLVRTALYPTPIMTIGYKQSGINYSVVGDKGFYNEVFTEYTKYLSYGLLPKNFKISFSTNHSANYNGYGYYTVGTRDGTFNNAYGGLITGLLIGFARIANYNIFTVRQCVNGNFSEETTVSSLHSNDDVTINIQVIGNNATVSGNVGSATYTFDESFDWGNSQQYNQSLYHAGSNTLYLRNLQFSLLDENGNIEGTINGPGVLAITESVTEKNFSSISASIEETSDQYNLYYRYVDNGNYTNWESIDFGVSLGIATTSFQIILEIKDTFSSVYALSTFYLDNTLVLQLVNLSNLTVLEAIQDLALISGYEFGVDRNGVFFFRPRVSSTTPIYEMAHGEILKVDTVKKNLSDFFTKLTLSFAQVPLEFYANTGARPNPIDKYGVINKDIDKPDIVNYDNPELAQAIGPQLLEIYAALPEIIQAVGKLNLALELGDIVNLKRNYPLTANPDGTDYEKYERQDTYYRACKITGMNYNFDKKQITYTLRDVSNSNNRPIPTEENTYMYEFPLDFGG